MFFTGYTWGGWDFSEGDEEISAKPTEEAVKRCECGAEHTDFPQIHYDWCPMHMKVGT